MEVSHFTFVVASPDGSFLFNSWAGFNDYGYDSARAFQHYCRHDPRWLAPCKSADSGWMTVHGYVELDREYRRDCCDPSELIERCSFATLVGEKLISGSYFRRNSEGHFTKPDLHWLEAFAPVVLTLIKQHLLLLQRAKVSSTEQQLRLLCAELSERERQVVVAACQGLTNKEIARRFGIAVSTVITYRLRAYDRLGVKCHSELIRSLLSSNRLEAGKA
jgi:DNA-binding CsgD family transcriptional regulator